MNEMRIDLDNGKYTYIYKDGHQEALRYGEPWRDLTGDNLVYNMAFEIDRLQQRVQALEESEKRWMQQASDFERLAVIAQQRADREVKLRNAQGEPVAWMHTFTGGKYVMFTTNENEAEKNGFQPLYTSAPTLPEGWQRSLQGHFRQILQHHGLTEHGDGVVEGDLIAAVLTKLTHTKETE